MTKDEALKMAIEALDTLMMEKGSIYQKALEACKEALEHPLTRDWKETIDERIAKDDEFKRALEQPSVAKLNDEYLRDTHVEGLSSSQDTHPAPSWQGNKEFVGLSDDELSELLVSKGETSIKYLSFARAIEQALKEKNNV